MKYFSGNLCLCLFIASFLMMSCRNRTTEETDPFGNRVIKEWYSRDRLKSSKTFLNSNPQDYIYVLYSSKGYLKDSARYINDTIEGMRKFYEEETSLLHIEHYHHGILNGTHKASFNTGIASFEGFRKNNLKVGEWKFQFENGMPITYEFYDSAGVMKYFRKYNEKGDVEKIDGSGLITLKSYQSDILVSESLNGFVEAAIPPGCKTQLTVEDISNGQAAESLLELVLEKPKSVWKVKFSNPGKKTLQFTLKIADIKTSKEEVNKAELTILVNPD
jgi:hypothetical protein